jgi:hypothetical protein
MPRPKGSKNAPKKKAAKNSIRNLEWVEPIQKTDKKDMEIAELTQICSIFTNWTADQKSRNLKYLCAKFYDFL